MLMMFGVGLHFSLDDLMAVRRIAVPGAVVQIIGATAAGAGVALWWGWSLGAALVFGLSLSVASTVVLLRALENRGVLESVNGRIAVGWLVAEQNRAAVEQLRQHNVHAVAGDVSEPEVLIQAHVVRASLLVVATPDTVKVRKIVQIARTLNPKIEMLLRTHSDEEAALLRQESLAEVFMGEHELALAMTRAVIERQQAVGR